MCMCVCVCMSQDIGVRGWCECVSHVWRWDLWVCGWAGVDVLAILTDLSRTVLASLTLTRKPSTIGTKTSLISVITIIWGWAKLPFTL